METLRRVVSPNAQTPIVVLTGTDEAVGIQAMRKGAQDTFRKDSSRRHCSHARCATRWSVKGTETILLVEDSESLREVTKEFLQLAGYNVMESGDGKNALQVAETYGAAIHLLLSDVVMPRMSGRELATEIKRIHPETRVLFMSGYTSNRGVLDEGVNLLTKPFTRSGLTQKVRETLTSSSG